MPGGLGIFSSIVQFALGLNKCHVFVVVACPLYFNFDVLYIACAPSLKQPVQVCILLSCEAVLAYSWLRLSVARVGSCGLRGDSERNDCLAQFVLRIGREKTVEEVSYYVALPPTKSTAQSYTRRGDTGRKRLGSRPED